MVRNTDTVSNSALLAYIIYRRSPLLTLNSGTRNGSVCEMYVHLYISCMYTVLHTYMYIYTVDRLRHAHIKLNRVQQISLSTYRQTHVSIGQKWKERKKKNPRKMIMMFTHVHDRSTAYIAYEKPHTD